VNLFEKAVVKVTEEETDAVDVDGSITATVRSLVKYMCLEVLSNPQDYVLPKPGILDILMFEEVGVKYEKWMSTDIIKEEANNILSYLDLRSSTSESDPIEIGTPMTLAFFSGIKDSKYALNGLLEALLELNSEKITAIAALLIKVGFIIGATSEHYRR